MRSFAQFNTDVALVDLLPRAEGLYLDLGCSHPTVMSNTYAHYLKGWRGIVVDPCRKIDLYAGLRPRDIAVPYAVGDRDGTITFHELSEDTWSTVSLEEARLRKVPFSTRIVQVRRVSTLLKELGWHLPFDLVSIDVEGHEEAVLAGCPFEDGWRPSVIVLEACFPCTETPSFAAWEHRLLAFGYEHVGTAGVNRLYKVAGYP